MVMMRILIMLLAIGLSGTVAGAVETEAGVQNGTEAGVQNGTEAGARNEAEAGAQNETEKASPWIPLPEGERILTMQDVPLDLMRRDPEKYLAMVFEDRFKFYHIYHSREDADPAVRQQVIVGKTHFTARPVLQSTQMIIIQITPAQDAWMTKQGIRRQDVLKAKVRFAGIAPGGALAFDLLEVEESSRSWLLRQPGDKTSTSTD